MNTKIESTLLKADANFNDIKALCNDAIQHHFYGVCIPPYFVKKTRLYLADNTDVKIITVVGFPLGYSATPAKVEETKKAIDEGADEIDMVINIAALKNNDLTYFENDIQSVATITQLKGNVIKVIIETALLSEEEIKTACKICGKIGVDFVKTSTGFAKEGATVENVAYLRKLLPKSIKIKASGGIKTKEQAKALIQAGADRLGTSNGLALI
ncbi:MAG: deoxyribose-phosphate aldolase [Chitinophagales bacterium]|nr:deoxyribose-phosphate aldolase [Chitinophagales bacterium]